MAERHVVLALAHGRSSWLSELTQWASSGALPIELVPCVSAAEIRARLASGRTHSAALLDGSSPAVDRAIIADLAAASCPSIVVESRTQRAWREIGAVALLELPLSPIELLDALDAHASRVSNHGTVDEFAASFDGRAGRVIMVCGTGGVGTSTIAAALAQGFGTTSSKPKVILVDGVRRAAQSILHDTGELTPNLVDLVELHRHRTPSDAAILAHCFNIAERSYRLLLGQPRPGAWIQTRAPIVRATLANVRALHDFVICEVDPDLDGAPSTSSAELDDRNAASRWASDTADVICVCVRGDLTGVHAGALLVRDFVNSGVPADRIQPLIVAAPRRPLLRADLAKAFALSVGKEIGTAPLAFVPSRRLNTTIRDAAPLPKAIVEPALSAVVATLNRLAPRHDNLSLDLREQSQRVEPGSLGQH